jgi:hypothetical protein
MFSSKALEINDYEVKQFIQKFKFNCNSVHSPINFVNKHKQWLSNNTFYTPGLEKFKHGYVVAGCTESFHEVYKEDCYVLKDEYTYHRDSGMAVVCDIDSVPLHSRLLISFPFAATGNLHNDWHYILKVCEEKSIRIFVDACLAGVSLGKLDLSHPCITHVAFSFSKAFGTGHMRTGVVYTNTKNTPASVRNTHLYLNHMHMDLHMKLMTEFDSDYIFKKYRMSQIKICEKHSLTQSDCVLFGLDNGRKCITRELESLQ